MIRVWLPTLTFFFFIFSGTVMQVFSPHWFGVPYELVPRFSMVVILFIGIFVNRPVALVYGLIFGFLYDIVYTNVIGVYFFSMAFTAYIIASIAQAFRNSLYTTFFLGLLGIVMLEIQVYGLYSIVGIAQMPLKPFLYDRLIPTLLLNGIFIILVFYPFRRLFHAIDHVRKQESAE